MVDDDDDDDGRTPDHGHPISSPCEPNGSGELKILLAIKPMRTQFKFTLRLICTPEYKHTPEYIYMRIFFAHANWT